MDLMLVTGDRNLNLGVPRSSGPHQRTERGLHVHEALQRVLAKCTSLGNHFSFPFEPPVLIPAP